MLSRTIMMSSAGAAGESEYWLATLGKTPSETSKSVAVDNTGNVYITFGSTSSFCFAKYNKSGLLQWQRELNGASTETSYAVAVDSSGNVYITGATRSEGAGIDDVLIAKYNTNGVIQWQRILGSNGNEVGRGIAVDSSGNVYIVGQIDHSVTASYDVLLAKYDTNGNIQWTRALGGSGGDYGRGIAVDSSGNVYITGYLDMLDAKSDDVLIAKYDTNGSLQWQRRLGGSGSGVDLGSGIAVDSSGNVYITGSTASQSAGAEDVLIAKYNTSGVIQWQRRLGGASSDGGNGIAVDSSGNIYITGYTLSQGGGGTNVLIAKYNTSGVIQWQRSLGGASDESGKAIAIDNAGNIYIAGETNSQGAGSFDALILKLPNDGTQTGAIGNFTYATTTLTDAATTLTAANASLTNYFADMVDAASTLTDAATTFTSTTIPIPVPYWIATLGGDLDDYGRGVAIDSGGNVYVTGYTASQGAGSYDVLVAKYNISGALQWQRRLGGAGTEYAFGIAVDNSGNVYVAGTTASQGAGSSDTLLAKYNTSGVLQWQRSLGGTGYDEGQGIAVDNSGNVYVAGTTASQGGGLNDVLITKYNTNGTIQWQRSLGGTNNDRGYGIAVDASGNVYVTGSTSSQGAGANDVLITKYNTSGTIQWQRSLGGSSSDEGYGIAVDSGGNVYVTGYTASQGAGVYDVVIIKYDTSGTIQWQRSLGGTGYDYGKGIFVDSNGNSYIAGYTDSQSAGGNDVLLAKYDTNGTIQWQRRLGGTGTEYGFGIVVDIRGSVCVVGQTNSQGVGSVDVLIAKLPAGGQLTGTYGALTYAATTLTDATRTLTSATRTLTSGTTTLTDAARTLTDAATTLTSTTTIVQAGA